MWNWPVSMSLHTSGRKEISNSLVALICINYFTPVIFTCSVDNVPLTESLIGNMSSSFRLPPENDAMELDKSCVELFLLKILTKET